MLDAADGMYTISLSAPPARVTNLRTTELSAIGSPAPDSMSVPRRGPIVCAPSCVAVARQTSVASLRIPQIDVVDATGQARGDPEEIDVITECATTSRAGSCRDP